MMDTGDLGNRRIKERDATIRVLTATNAALEDRVARAEARADSVSRRRDEISRHLTMAYTAISEITRLVQGMEDD